MSETAQHLTGERDASTEAINALALLDLGSLSFVQLKRLEKVLQHAVAAVTAESTRRAETDHSGDTVNLQAPHI